LDSTLSLNSLAVSLATLMLSKWLAKVARGGGGEKRRIDGSNNTNRVEGRLP
jgi:hypothetical protein